MTDYLPQYTRTGETSTETGTAEFFNHTRAAIAIGRSILEIAYHVLRDGVAYEELGVNYYDERKKGIGLRPVIVARKPV